MSKSKVIWLVAAAVLALGVYQQSLGFADIFAIFMITSVLVGMFKDDAPIQAMPETEPEIEKQERVAIPAGQHLITTDAVKQFRNILLRHHNMKQTDVGYTESDMSKQTVAIVARLNVFLKGR